jgi:CTP-dependent riboflavin kinase
VLRGTVCSGIGDQARRVAAHPDIYRGALGYHPYPGSLNVHLDDPLSLDDLPDPHATIEVNGDRSLLWHARLNGAGPAHLMIFRAAPTVARVEVLAPVRLRTLLDSDRVTIEVDEC